MLKRKPKNKKSKNETPTIFKKPIQSTQQNIPIRDIVDGVVITTDNQYVKTIEILPIPFFLKKPTEQSQIFDQFKAVLKICPDEVHFKSISTPANLSKQINDLKKKIQIESNSNCKQMGKEYEQRLLDAENTGITRRFFLSFAHSEFRNSKESLSEIVYTLNSDARSIAYSIEGCGNEVVLPDDDNPNGLIANLLYTLYNRNSALKTPFETHVEDVYKRYYKDLNTSQFYVPPTDYLAPHKISFSDPKYLICDGVYYSFLVIPSNGYNNYVKTGWLDTYISSYNGVDVDIFLKRKDADSVLNDIRRNISHNQVNAEDARSNSDAFDTSNLLYQSNNYLKDGLRNGQDFYYMTILITVSSTNPDDVDFMVKELKKAARQSNIQIHDCKYQNEAAFRSALPLSTMDDSLFKKLQRNILTNGVATTYPFTTFQMIHPEGLYIADDTRTGSPIIPDFFNKKVFNNPHIFICGETGAGKTVSLLTLALRARVEQIPVFIIAPEKQDEFKRVTDAIGGQFVSIGLGSPNRINIMEIFMTDQSGMQKKELIDRMEDTSSKLAEKEGTLMEFFQLLIPRMDVLEKQYLNEAIHETYKNFGITDSNDSLWADETRKKYKKMPIISDLVAVLEQKPETKSLATAIRSLTMGSGSHFNGETNVDIDNNFFVIGLEHNTKDLLGLSIYMAMDYVWTKVKEDRTQNKFLIIDEWWKMAFNQIAADKSLEISKIARAYGCSMVIATQQMSDILAIENGKYGNAVLNNCATKILMSMKEKDIMSVSEMVGLTKEEHKAISRFKAGEGLLIAGDSRMTLRFTPSETEKLLTFTDKATLDKVARLEQQKKKDMEIEEEKRNAKSMAETFVNASAKVNTVELVTSEHENEIEISTLIPTKDIIKKNKGDDEQ